MFNDPFCFYFVLNILCGYIICKSSCSFINPVVSVVFVSLNILTPALSPVLLPPCEHLMKNIPLSCLSILQTDPHRCQWSLFVDHIDTRSLYTRVQMTNGLCPGLLMNLGIARDELQ